MLCKDVMYEIEKEYPLNYALSWDNVGLLVGRDDKEVKRIYIALDATDEVIDEAVRTGADMLITHHPMIFSPIKRIHNLDFVGERILKLIQNDISYYAMHTNYDVLGMADLSGDKMNMKNAEILEVTAEGDIGKEDEPEGIGRVSDLETPMTLRECCEDVKSAFHLGAVKVFGNLEEKVKRIAAQGLAIIDGGHYGIEHIFIEDMRQYLEKHLSEVEIVAAPISHPFLIV